MQVARQIAWSHQVSLESSSLATFLLQQALHELESSSTFRKDCGNAATDF